MLTALVYAHCSITYIGYEGQYAESRNTLSGDGKAHFPLNHAEMPSYGTNDEAVCRGTTAGAPSHTVAPGSTLSLSFLPECNTGTEGQVPVMEQGQQTTAEAGDYNGGPRHGGGFCEVSITTNPNPTWNDFVVISQWENTCPDASREYEFTLPATTPNGPLVIAWTWHSAFGLAEMYTTCMDVEVQGSTAQQQLSGRCPEVQNIVADESVYKYQDDTCESCGSRQFMGVGFQEGDISNVDVMESAQMGCSTNGQVATVPTNEAPAVEQPAVEQPAVEQPEVEQPAVEQPSIEQPAVEQPPIEQPAVEQPAVEQPEEQPSMYTPPVIEEPVVEQPEMYSPAQGSGSKCSA